MTAIAARRATWKAAGLIALIMAGVGVFGLGVAMVHEWRGFPAPEAKRIPLYQNALTTFLPGESFSPGYPSLKISMAEFEKESVGAQFTVYYPKLWETVGVDYHEHGQTSDQRYWAPAVYHMKKPGTDIYLYAVMKAPDFNREPGYYMRTGFNHERKEFFSFVTGAAYGQMWVGMILGLLGFMIALASYIALYDERDWTWVDDFIDWASTTKFPPGRR